MLRTPRSCLRLCRLMTRLAYSDLTVSLDGLGRSPASPIDLTSSPTDDMQAAPTFLEALFPQTPASPGRPHSISRKPSTVHHLMPGSSRLSFHQWFATQATRSGQAPVTANSPGDQDELTAYGRRLRAARCAECNTTLSLNGAAVIWWMRNMLINSSSPCLPKYPQELWLTERLQSFFIHATAA